MDVKGDDEMIFGSIMLLEGCQRPYFKVTTLESLLNDCGRLIFWDLKYFMVSLNRDFIELHKNDGLLIVFQLFMWHGPLIETVLK